MTPVDVTTPLLAKEDVYHTTTKTKYLKGIVVSTVTSVATAGEETVTSTGSLRCSKGWFVKDENGTDYIIPLYTVAKG